MRYCKRCLYPENHPLGIIFDDEGVCSGCRVHEEKDDEIDWEARHGELESILRTYQGKHPAYDCVIPVTGNGDSYFVVHMMKKVFGLRPLLVTYNIHYNTKIGIRNMANLLTQLDCDHLLYTVNPKLAKQVTWHAMHAFGDMYWHCLAGSQTFPVQVATKMGIPLVVWGVNGWLDQVGMFSHWDLVEMSKKVRKEHALRGWDVQRMVQENDEITTKMMQAFTYPSDKQLEHSRVRGIYLGNFVRWDAQQQTEQMIDLYNYETCPQERTFNRYETIYDFHNAGVHDYIKYLKYGYGKVTDHGSRDIRLKRMTREQAIELVLAYQNKEPKDMKLFLEWLGMTEEQFYACIDKFRDPNIWERQNSEWKLKCSVADAKSMEGVVDEVCLAPVEPKEYVQTDNREPIDEDNRYLLMGRAYIDERNYKADR